MTIENLNQEPQIVTAMALTKTLVALTRKRDRLSVALDQVERDRQSVISQLKVI